MAYTVGATVAGGMFGMTVSGIPGAIVYAGMSAVTEQLRNRANAKTYEQLYLSKEARDKRGIVSDKSLDEKSGTAMNRDQIRKAVYVNSQLEDPDTNVSAGLLKNKKVNAALENFKKVAKTEHPGSIEYKNAEYKYNKVVEDYIGEYYDHMNEFIEDN